MLMRKPCTNSHVQIVCSVVAVCLQEVLQSCLVSKQEFVNSVDIGESIIFLIAFCIFYVYSTYL